MKVKPNTKYESLGYLLGEFGSDRITRDQFWGQMKQLGYTQDDIDKWCDEFYQLEAKKELDDARRKETQGGTERAEPARTARGAGVESKGTNRQDLRAAEGIETARQDGGAVQEDGEARSNGTVSGEVLITLSQDFIDWVDANHANRRLLAMTEGAQAQGGQPDDFETRVRETRMGGRGEAAVRKWIGKKIKWRILEPLRRVVRSACQTLVTTST